MNLFFLLILNLTIFAALVGFSWFMFFYNKGWYLRLQRLKYIYNNFYDKFILLEIKLPREVTKSPQAMEFVIDALFQMAGNPAAPDRMKDGKKKGMLEYIEDKRKYKEDAYTQGQMRMWTTLEIESRGGEIHFYIGTIKKLKDIISSYIFSQYPGIEVTEVEDYTNKIRSDMFGGEHVPYTSYVTLAGTKKSYLPIKTYVDYGLDKDPKDEFKIDPLIPLLESMANIHEDEHMWYQVLVRATQDKDMRKDAEKRIDELLGIKRDEKGKIIEQTKDLPKLLPKEKQEIELIHRFTEKLAFDVQIKMVFWCPKSKGLRGEGTEIIRNAMKSFNNQNFNTFAIGHQNTTHSFLDYKDRRREKRARAAWSYLYTTRNPLMIAGGVDPTPFKTLIQRYKGYGYRSAKDVLNMDLIPYFTKFGSVETEMPLSFILNSEEIATIYHFPSRAFTAPKFARVESVKSEPPANLPI